ncbi:MAG: HTH-type transcriptional repressor RspR [Pseudomonas sp.]|nr:MAG: HTH-type transcriptional repressor RspR [Pseudomonas sp.]
MLMESPAKSQTQAIYERLRAEVLSCVLPPASRVNLKALAEQYQASAGAVREALSRLTAEGLVVAEPQKGFRIAPVSLADLADLTQARVEIDTSCLRHAIENADLAWESRVVAAYHCLSRSAGPEAGARYDAEAWNTAHGAFHEALMSACPNAWLSRMRTMLFEQNSRYRAMSVAFTAGHRDLDGEHKALLDAALAKDTPRATGLLAAHIRETSAAVMAGLKAHSALSDG